MQRCLDPSSVHSLALPCYEHLPYHRRRLCGAGPLPAREIDGVVETIQA
jgi:hypothetical protein